MPEMNRRDVLRSGAIVGTGIAAGTFAGQCAQSKPVKGDRAMKAGFARVKITPPVGTAMTGFGSRDRDAG